MTLLEWMEQPAARLLRALRFFDWIEMTDLLVVLNVPDFQGKERNRYDVAMSRLHKAGVVKRRRTNSILVREGLRIGVRGRTGLGCYEYTLARS